MEITRVLEFTLNGHLLNTTKIEFCSLQFLWNISIELQIKYH